MGTPFLKMQRAGDCFPRLDPAHIFFPHAPLLMTGPIRVPLELLRAPFLANLASLSWGWAFLDVPLNGLSYDSTSFDWIPLSFSISDTVILALLGTSLVNVLTPAFLVARYLFNMRIMDKGS